MSATLDRLAAALPDFGSAETPAFCAAAGAFLGAAAAFATGRSRAEVQWWAFVGGFCGAGFGFTAYVLGLIADLY